jgi:hypothetical protein
VGTALSEHLLFSLPERHLGQKSREVVGQMPPATPTPSTQLNADQSTAACPIVLTAPTTPGEAEPVGADIVTGLELRLVPSPREGKGVLFERVAVDDHPSVANHLEDLREMPIIAAGPIVAAGPIIAGPIIAGPIVAAGPIIAGPIVAAGPRLASSRRTAGGQPRCNCWQSLRLLGSTRRHDHDHLTGSSSAVGCPACGRGLLSTPLG